MKPVIHNNNYWWGHSQHIIIDNGCGIITCSFIDDEPNTCWLSSLSVVEEKRKQGRGTRLIELAKMLAADNDCTALMLRVEKNVEWLVNWYKRLGFVIDDSYEDEHYVQMTMTT